MGSEKIPALAWNPPNNRAPGAHVWRCQILAQAVRQRILYELTGGISTNGVLRLPNHYQREHHWRGFLQGILPSKLPPFPAKRLALAAHFLGCFWCLCVGMGCIVRTTGF